MYARKINHFLLDFNKKYVVHCSLINFSVMKNRATYYSLENIKETIDSIKDGNDTYFIDLLYTDAYLVCKNKEPLFEFTYEDEARDYIKECMDDNPMVDPMLANYSK